MLKRALTLLVVVFALSFGLVACGSDAAVPTYPGGTSTAVPPTLKTSLDSSMGSVKNGKTDAYTTSDAPDKAKSTLADKFKSNGWEDKTSEMGLASANQMGMSAIGYQAGDKAASAVILPAEVANLMGGSQVPAGGSMVIVISGSK